MKLKTIAVAVAALAAGTAAHAAAITVAQAKAAANHIYTAGASATQVALQNAMKDAICDSTKADFTLFKSSLDAKNNLAYACTAKAVTGFSAAGDIVVVHHDVAGGSLYSVLAMSTAAANQRNFIDFTSCSSGDGTNTVTGCSSAAKRSNGGFSDVNLDLFKATLPASLAGVNYNNIVVSQANAGQSFGVAVSAPLYAALQARQGTTGIPSISKTEYASLIAQPSAAFLSDWTPLGIADAQKVVICRRPDTSGTQASSGAYFLGQGCSGAGVSPAAAADSSAALGDGLTSGLVVIENAGTGDAKTCLNNGSTAVAGDQYRMGVVSMENAPAATDSWKFVQIDGQLPSTTDGVQIDATVNMKYAFANETVIHTDTTDGATTAKAGVFFSTIAATMGNPAITNLRGIYVVPGTFRNSDSTRVAKGTKGGSACSPMSYAF